MSSYLHPGVYIEEIPSGSKPIEGVATSNALFVGYTNKGPIGEASLIFKWDDYVDSYGGIAAESDAMGLSVNMFYLNGGQAAYIARLAANTLSSGLGAAQMVGRATGPAAGINVLTVTASSAGAWGDAVHVRATNAGDGYRFKLEVGGMEGGSFAPSEVFDGLSMDTSDSRYALTVVNAQSKLVRVDLAGPLKSSPNTYYRQGTSESGDLSAIAWTDVHQGMKLTVNINNLGARTITLGPPPGGAYSTSTKVRDELQSRIRELGSENAYQNASVGFAANKVTITVGYAGRGFVGGGAPRRAGNLAQAGRWRGRSRDPR